MLSYSFKAFKEISLCQKAHELSNLIFELKNMPIIQTVLLVAGVDSPVKE
jgi:hypothetical protein